MTVFDRAGRKLSDRIPDGLVRGGAIAITLALAFTLTIPLSQALVPIEGDYGRTVPVDYGDGVIIDAPASESRVLRTGFSSSMHAFVDGNDPAVRQLAPLIADGTDARRDLDTVTMWIHRSIEYADDPHGMVSGDRWQMPGETLRIGKGDCEDMAILGASVMSALGYGTVLVFEDGHVLFGADAEPRVYDHTVRCNGVEYVTADATSGRTGVFSDPYLVTDCKWNGQVIAALAALSAMLALMLYAVLSPMGRDLRWNPKSGTRTATSASIASRINPSIW